LSTTPKTGSELDLASCDNEPIRIPGSIQPHGFLFVLEPHSHTVIQVSENVAELTGVAAASLVGRDLSAVLGAELAESLREPLQQVVPDKRPVFLRTVALRSPNGQSRSFEALVHVADGGLVLELESSVDSVDSKNVYAVVDRFATIAETAPSVTELSNAIAREVRQLTGFDRVLVYHFDEDANGTVVGEDGNGRLPSLMDHRFPAGDIPAQARELYRHNRLRLIPDAGYLPVPIVPTVNSSTGRVLDMTFSVLRSVSPIHVEYMKNMGTASSMSISILRDGNLWGLISCHHTEPKAASFEVRATCDLLARTMSLRLAALERAGDYERRIEVRQAFARLLSVMAERLDFVAGLSRHSDDLLTFAGAGGAAIVSDNDCVLVGKTPGKSEVRPIADWLFREAKGDVYSTDSLAKVYPAADAFKDSAAGLLAISVSKLNPKYVLWFRPEVIQTVKWGGDPNKAAYKLGEEGRIHPRQSFSTWREIVRGKSLGWARAEIEAAAELRNAIVEVVLAKAEQVANLNAELERSNKDLEAFSYSVSHDLRAPLRHVAGYAEMLRENAVERLSDDDRRCIKTIIDSSELAGALVDRLLAFARLGRGDIQMGRVDMNEIVRDARRDAEAGGVRPDVGWKIGELPPAKGDPILLRQVVRNLLENALKYTRNRQAPAIEVGGMREADSNVFFVRDNGVGFDMKYADKLFGVFQRLHRMEDYEGTGIGLANVRRIVERHGGKAWGEGQEGVGDTFFFSLPKVQA
jgi:chemotaxis family two-component system sensor kinase Cph1